MRKRALIIGVGGMDGSHLAELLLKKGYEVHGLARRSSYDNLARLPASVRERVTMHRGDVTDPTSVMNALYVSRLAAGDEVYNMADQDDVGWSRDVAGQSVQVTYGGCATVLEVIRLRNPKIKVFQPISSTVFGPDAGPCDESTPLAPASPYAVAKAAAWLLCKHYRREHGVHVCCGVFFNHTSPRQKWTYLLPTIARQAMEVKRGKREYIELAGPDVCVDVGWAPDYVEAAWRILQQGEPCDRCVGTGIGGHVSSWCQTALLMAGGDANSFRLKDDAVRWGSTADWSRMKEMGWLPINGGTAIVGKLLDYFKEELR